MLSILYHTLSIYDDVHMDITPRYASIQNMHCSPVVEKEEESSRPCVVWEVPRELLPYKDQLMPPLYIGFERSEENI